MLTDIDGNFDRRTNVVVDDLQDGVAHGLEE